MFTIAILCFIGALFCLIVWAVERKQDSKPSNTPFTKGDFRVRPNVEMRHVRVVATAPLKPEVKTVRPNIEMFRSVAPPISEPEIHYSDCAKVYNPNGACFCAVWDR